MSVQLKNWRVTGRRIYIKDLKKKQSIARLKISKNQLKNYVIIVLIFSVWKRVDQLPIGCVHTVIQKDVKDVLLSFPQSMDQKVHCLMRWQYFSTNQYNLSV